MKQVTKELVKKYKIKQMGIDFCGYLLEKNDIYTYHHLIIPKKNGGKQTEENGVVLCGETSHPYIHLIENIEPEIFYYITSEMIDQKIKGKLDIENLKRIHELLRYFESKHLHDRGNKGKRLIKEKYLIRPKLDTI